MAGRKQISEWIASTMNTFPGSEMPFYPVTWYSIDVEKGWVFSEIMNRMKDPATAASTRRRVSRSCGTGAAVNGATKRTPTTR